MKKKKTIVFLIIFLSILSILIYSKIYQNKKVLKVEPIISEEVSNNSNIIENVNYVAKDTRGNEYIINALQGEIDYSNSNIIYLTKVQATIKMIDSDIIEITSDFGKYNINNFDTIFSKNVTIDYLDNKIIGEYLDFSLRRNSMIVSRNVVYTNLKNIMRADVIEVDIKTKNTKIFMYENKKKINIKSKD